MFLMNTLSIKIKKLFNLVAWGLTDPLGIFGIFVLKLASFKFFFTNLKKGIIIIIMNIKK